MVNLQYSGDKAASIEHNARAIARFYIIDAAFVALATTNAPTLLTEEDVVDCLVVPMLQLCSRVLTTDC